jgi:HlyD family secretion protein
MTTPEKKPEQDITRTLDLDAAQPRRRVARLVCIVAAVVVAAGGAAWALHSRSSANGSIRYDTQPVTRGDLVKTVSATGTLQPIKEVSVGIEVSGTIKTVDVDYNDRVTVGQVLARLDTSKLDAEVLESEASLESARAKLLQSQATVQEADAQMARLLHVRELSGGKVPSQYDLDTQQAVLARARADAASSQAAVTQAQATLNVNRSDLEKAVIHSPINGIVLMRAVEPGQTVAASFSTPTLFTLAEDLAKLELQVNVDEADVGQVHEGQEASFTVDAYPDHSFPANLTQVRFSSSTTDGVVTYTTILKVDNASLILRPGMTATATITTTKVKQALLVPNAALRFEPPQATKAVAAKTTGGGSLIGSLMPHPPHEESKANEAAATPAREQRVWTLRDGQLQAVPVKIGETDGKFTEISDGELKPDMDVVVDVLTAKP